MHFRIKMILNASGKATCPLSPTRLHVITGHTIWRTHQIKRHCHVHDVTVIPVSNSGPSISPHSQQLPSGTQYSYHSSKYCPYTVRANKPPAPSLQGVALSLWLAKGRLLGFHYRQITAIPRPLRRSFRSLPATRHYQSHQEIFTLEPPQSILGNVVLPVSFVIQQN